MSTNRLEALRLAVTLNSDSDKVISTAQKFHAFLEDAIAPANPRPAETVKEPAKESEKVEPKTETKAVEVDIKTRVQALAKALLSKSRPKLVEVLKELGFEKASLIPDASLPAAEKAFTKAVAEAA
jgi:hypothetical protein